MNAMNNFASTSSIKKLSQMPFNAVSEFRAGVLPRIDDRSVVQYLADFRPTYPDFQNWLNGKVLPEVFQNSSEREVIFVLSKDNLSVAGFSILKNTSLEKKICSFYISPAFQKVGYGSLLMEESFRFLGTTSPLITMPEKCKELFSRLLKKYKFSFVHELQNYYLDGETEYVFNGILH